MQNPTTADREFLKHTNKHSRMSDVADRVIVGLISDTHGVLEDTVIEALKRATDTIIHAGDIGDMKYTSRLSVDQVINKLKEGTGKSIIAVSGNVDIGCTDLPESVGVTINGKKLFVKHICGVPPSKEIKERVNSETTDIVVFGHSHVPGTWHDEGVLFVNPGSAGPRRFKLPRCIAFLSISKSGDVSVEFTPVATLPQDTLQLPPPLKLSSEKSQSRCKKQAKRRNCKEKEANMYL